VHFENVTFQNNEKFESVIAGHFAHVHIISSLFINNQCPHGVLALTGMEKQLMIFNNQFLSNEAPFVVLFDMESQSEILGQVLAYFVRNRVRGNRIHESLRNAAKILNNATYQPMSFAIGLKGHQKVNVTKNLLGGNDQDYELLAGIKTAKIDNFVNVIENW